MVGIEQELAAPHIFIAARAHRLRFFRRAQDGRPNEDHQVGARMGAAAAAEEVAQHRNVAEQWHPLDRAPVIVVEQPADRDDLAVVHRDRILDLALVEDEILEGRRDRPGDGTDLHAQVELDRVAGVDLRLHLQRDADILPLHGAESVVEIGRERLPGRHRDFLPDQDVGLLVVERHDVRRGQDVGIAVVAYRADD
jgi:hypothetical protein